MIFITFGAVIAIAAIVSIGVKYLVVKCDTDA